MATPTPANAVSYFVDPGGRVYEVPASSADAELRLGSQVASPSQVADYRFHDALAKKYGSGGQSVLAGVESGLDAATLGVSTAAEVGFGADPTAIEARQEANPTISTVGSVAGILAPTLLSGGESAVEDAATGAAAGAGEGGFRAGLKAATKFAPPALISRLGGAVSEGVASALPEASGTVGKIVSKAVSAGLGSAVEGAVYGGGQVVHEAALGDPDLTAQKALATVGLSAALGGGIGSALGVGEVAASKALQSAKAATQKVDDWFVQHYPSIGSKLTGASEDDIRTILTNRQRLVDGTPLVDVLKETRPTLTEPAPFVPADVPEAATFKPGIEPDRPKFVAPQEPEAVGRFAKELSERLGEQMDATEAAAKEAGTEFRVAESASLINDTVEPSVAHAEALRLAGKTSELAEQFRGEGPDLFDQGVAARLEKIRDGLLRDVSDQSSAADTFQRINEAKRLVFDETKVSEAAPRRDVLTARAVRDLFHDFKGSLEDQSVWGEAGVRQSQFNAAYSEFKSAQKDLNSYFTRKVPNRSGSFDRVPDPSKIQGWLSSIDAEKSALKTDAFARYQAASRALHDEIEKSASAVGGRYDRGAVEDLLKKSEGTVQGARENALVAARADAERQAQKEALAEYREKLTTFRENEAERKLAAKKALAEFNESEAERKAAAKEAANEYKSAKKAQDTEIKDSASKLRANGRWNGFMDIIGAGAVGHNPVTAPLFVGYRSMKYLGSPDRAVRLLAAFERSGSNLSKRISTAAAVLAGVGRAARSAAIGTASRATRDGGKLSLTPEMVADLAHNPSKLVDALSNMTKGVHDAAPQTGQALQVATARAVEFLGSKLPKPPDGGPLAPSWKPSPAETSKFNRYASAVEKPTSILEHAKDGTLTPEHVEAVSTVYPELFASMQAALVDKLADRPSGKPLPYQQRLMVSMLLRSDIDGSRGVGARGRAAVGAPQQPPPESVGPSKATPARADHLHLADRLSTPFERSAQRDA